MIYLQFKGVKRSEIFCDILGYKALWGSRCDCFILFSFYTLQLLNNKTKVKEEYITMDIVTENQIEPLPP